MTIATLSPAEARALIAQGARLIDIRDADEYAREHIPDAELVPLASLTNGATLNARAGETVIFHCQAGSRTQNNAIRGRRRRTGAGKPAGRGDSGLEGRGVPG